MARSSVTQSQEELIAQLAGMRQATARIDFLRQNPKLRQQSVALYLVDQSVKAVRENVDHALELAETASWLAEILNDDFCRAKSARAMGHSLSLKGKYQEALENYQKSHDLFQNLGEEIEAARTLSGSIQALIYVSDYEEALRRAERARKIFKRHGDHLRLARLDVNLANVLHRQERFEDALVLYRRALPALERSGEPGDMAIALNNIAVCCIGLHDFLGALDANQQARAYAEQHEMLQLTAQAKYNIAYLHYLRGEHTRAIKLYQHARTICDRVGDAYHSALCDLDQSEIYLDISLFQEAALLARQALASFEELKMGYEAAKALTFLATITYKQGELVQSLQLFSRAKQLFVSERNAVWPAILDLYRALVFYHSGQAKDALDSVEAAQSLLSHSSLVGKAALAELLRASLLLVLRDIPAASYWSNFALEHIERSGVTTLLYLAQFVHGQTREAEGDIPAAHQCYNRALAALENLHIGRHAEELRIPLLTDTSLIYETVIGTTLSQADKPHFKATAFDIVERAKSGQLADLISFSTQGLLPTIGVPTDTVDPIRDLRRELDWGYRQMDLGELGKEQRSSECLQRLRQRIRENEVNLPRALEQLRATGTQSSRYRSAEAIPLERIRRIMPSDCTLVNYFKLRGSLSACVLNQAGLEIFTLAPIVRVRDLLRSLHKHFSEVQECTPPRRVGSEVAQRANVLLEELYSALLAPLREGLQGRRLIIVPQGFLHYIPFHALYDGSRFLLDQFTVSYCTSASLYYHLGSAREVKLEERSLIFSVSDGESPRAVEAAQIIAAALPNARLRLGDEAIAESLRKDGPGCQHIHLETQAVYRHDNPLFSTLALRGSPLNLFDLYHMHLPCSLLTLGGCGPALDEIQDGQEMVALVCGFHTAGAQGVLTSLWNAPEPSRSELLASFCRQTRHIRDKAEALQRAILAFRDTNPHPYHWAPFALWGSSTPSRNV